MHPQCVWVSRAADNSPHRTCLGTHDPTQDVWTDASVDNAARSWTWIVCNEVGFYQVGAPLGQPTIVSRLIQPPYDERQCTYMFPEVFTTPPVPAVDKTNQAYDGWFVQEKHLFFANGDRACPFPLSKFLSPCMEPCRACVYKYGRW